jgi:uncharacterized membrane protein
MNLRLTLYELAAQQRLEDHASAQLRQLAGLHDEPPALTHGLVRGIAVLAASLGGLGIVLWIAANWDNFGRGGRFALLQAIVAVACLGALLRPNARLPSSLLALLGIGALFAYFGQTYQTGADPWQLFALWAVLALPLCLAARSDALWAPWALVAMTALSLWVHAHTGHQWRVTPVDLRAHALAWLGAAVLTAALSPALSRFTGAGVWALRTALTLAVVMFSVTALGGLFHHPVAPHYALALIAMFGATLLLALPRWFDVYGLSAVALGLITLLVPGLARVLFDRPHANEIGTLLLIGLAAAGLLAASVSVLLRLARRYGVHEQGAAS